MLVEGLVGKGSEVIAGYVVFGFNTAVVVLGLSSFSITTWESICLDSSLDSRLSTRSSSSLLSSPCFSA